MDIPGFHNDPRFADLAEEITSRLGDLQVKVQIHQLPKAVTAPLIIGVFVVPGERAEETDLEHLFTVVQGAYDVLKLEPDASATMQVNRVVGDLTGQHYSPRRPGCYVFWLYFTKSQ